MPRFGGLSRRQQLVTSRNPRTSWTEQSLSKGPEVARHAPWPWWQQYTGPDQYRLRENLRAVWDLHAMYDSDTPWLWRGQANAKYAISPGMHSRVQSSGALTDERVLASTEALLHAARLASLDVHEGVRLPDMALLARLQHHGAATPLLDVSLDPMVGLYMAVVEPNGVHVETDGALFAIRRPAVDVADFDSRTFREIYEEGVQCGKVAFYSAPDVSDRLRIQRGHFLLGPVGEGSTARVTVPLTVENTTVQNTWLASRMNARGRKGPVPRATTDIGVFRVVGKFKTELKAWLEARSGLTDDFVYPTSWHQPHLDRFARAHSRTAPWV